MKQELLDQEHQRAHHIFEREKLPIISATPEEMYRIAENNPNLFGVKYTRWGCHFKCVKCNGYRVNTGGIRSLLQISIIVNQQKYEHRKGCKHPRWEEHWSLHAAEIAHTFVQMTTNRTSTGTTDWVDITGAVITSGNFTTSRKYLIITDGWLTGSSTSADVEFSTLHGSTRFTESHSIGESQTIGMRMRWGWFTVWTAVAAEAIKEQFKGKAAVWTIEADICTIMSIEISEDLTEGTDWEFAHDSSSRSLDTTFTADASITISSGDHTAGDTYLVMAYGRINPTDNAGQMECRLARSGEATSTLPNTGFEGEDVAQDTYINFLLRPFDLGASDNTFTLEARNSLNSVGSITHSSVFALNLEKFNQSTESYTEATVNLNIANWSTDILRGHTITPTATGDICVFAYFVGDCVATQTALQSRMQIDDSDEPTGQSTYLTQWQAYDPKDRHHMFHQTIINLDNTEHTVDLEGDMSNVSSTPTAETRTVVTFELELAGAAPTKTFTMDAMLQKTQSKTFTLDSRLVNVFQKTFGMDSMLQKIFIKTFTIDSTLLKKFTKTFTLDAALKKKFTKTFALDSILKKTLTKTFTLDSAVQGAQQKMFAIDSIVRNTLSKTFTFDSTLRQRVTRTFTMNARLVRIGLTKTFSMDSVLKKTLTKTLTLDSILTTLTTTKLFSIDAILKKTLSKTLTLDSILKKTFSKTFSMDSRLVKTLSKAFTLDSIIKTTFSKTFNADAILQKTLSKTFLLDGCIQQEQTSKTFTLDAVLKKKFSKTFALDGCVQQEQFTKTFTMDTVLVFTGARPGTIAIGTPRGTTAKF